MANLNISSQNTVRIVDSARISTQPAKAAEKPAPAATIAQDSVKLEPGLDKVPKGIRNGALAGAGAAALGVALPLIASTIKHHDGSVAGGMIMVGSIATVVGGAAGAIVGGTSAGLSENKWKATAIGAGAGALIVGGAMLFMSRPSMMNIKDGAAMFVGLAAAAGAAVGGGSAYAGALAAQK